MAVNFTFSEAHFNRLFPFYILINQQMVVETNGKTLDKLFAGISGKKFADSFKIKRPELEELNFESLKSLANELLIIECFNEQHTNLRGQIDYLPETDQLLFLGSPWFDSIEKVIENKLSLNDFAFHDSMTDLLHVLKTQEITNDDLKHLLQTVSQQKNELNKANKAYHDIALFPTQNPDPIIRINYEGDLLQNNPAAAQLDFIEFEDKVYRNDDFFKLISTRIDTSEKRWNFEAHSSNKDYSFVCITMREEGYINIYGRDISQSKKDLQQLERLSLIIKQSHQAVVITDAHANVEWVNEAFEKVTGYTFDEVKGKRPGSMLQGIDTDPATVKFIRSQINEAKAFTTEIYNYKKSGKGYWLRINCQPVFDQNGKLFQFFAIEEDITVEKQAQEKLKAVASRMSSLISNLHAGILLVNANRTIELVNQRFCDFFKIADNPSDMIGRGSLDTIAQAKAFSKDPESFVTETNLLIKERALVIGEKLEMIDGLFLERDFIPIWNEGKYDGHLMVYTDITEKINVDKKIEDQRIFYEEILDNIPADIAVFDKDHHYLFVNPKGIKDPALRKWIIGKKDEDYIQLKNKPASIVEERRNVFNSILASKQLKSWEEEFIQPDGDIHYILRHMYPVLDKDAVVKLVIGYGVDITHTKSILLQIEQSEKRYRDVIENSLALVTTHDLNGKILTINPIVSTTYGYTDQEIIGHSLTDFMPLEEKVFFIENYLFKIKKEKKHSGIYRVIHKNGNIIYTLYNNFLKEEPGKEPYVIGFAVDITDRIKAEEELKIAQKITEELALTKQNFLANMSHEIRTPMNAIMGMASQLSKTALNKEQQFYLNIIHSASDNLLIIINEILDLSKIEAGKLTLEHIGFRLKSKIDRIMQVMMLKAEEKELLFTNSFFDDQFCDVLLGDPYRLNQIMLNLLSNAFKFTEKGSVDIRCTLIAESKTHQTIEVSVKDTGIGMDASFVKNLFNKFTQEDESITRRFGGTGLGMSICKELVELMGGTIAVESQKGIGTTVSFVIPFEKGAIGQLAVKEEIVKVDTTILAGKKILITDDNEMNRLVATTILNSYGVITEEAKNGKEAIEKIWEVEFDLVLMDMQMPVMDGVEATYIIRNTISKSLPVIALTAFAIKGDDVKFLEAGMNDYLSKPFEEMQLLRIVTQWLRKGEEKVQKEIKAENRATLFDLSKLKEISKGNQAFVDKMVNLFITQIPASMSEMQEALQQNDFATIKSLAHRIRPSIDILSISTAQNVIRQIELLAKENKDSYKLTQLINELDNSLNQVVQTIAGAK